MKYILDHEGKPYRKFFEEIAAIPHESFHEKALSDYIVNFAKERGLWHHQDEVWNVIIHKPASAGYETHEPVMIQGHIDMVCVKTPESDHDFDVDPLELYVKDGFLRARGTTLGADCGHGISYMLAILDDDTLKHPPLECLFTVQEEVGIGGPKHLDYSLLHAKRMIATDSMGEGAPELSTTSVLGGRYQKSVAFEPVDAGDFYQVEIGGFAGGHAAVDINKGRGNAIKIAARAAFHLLEKAELRLCTFSGGTLKNNIPQQAEFVFWTKPEMQQTLPAVIDQLNQDLQQEFAKTDDMPCIRIRLTKPHSSALSLKQTKELVHWMMGIPSGTYLASPQEPAFPLTSRNLGTAILKERVFELGYMYRTSIASHIKMLFDEQAVLSELYGAVWEEEYQYPGYSVEPGTPMYETYAAVYRELSGKELTPIHIHAGTDVGTIIQGMGGTMDVVGIGPNTRKFHTPEEELELASYDRVYQYIINVLERL